MNFSTFFIAEFAEIAERNNYFLPTLPSLRFIFYWLIFCIIGASFALADSSPDTIWKNVSERNIHASKGQRRIIPDQYKTYRLNLASLQTHLRQAPAEMYFPYPDGTYRRFYIEKSQIMEQGLAARFPEIQTFIGKGIDEPSATLRCDWTPHGFHAMVLSPNGTVLIDPYRTQDVLHYISYYKKDYRREDKKFECLVRDSIPDQQLLMSYAAAAPVTLRTYRVAIGATGEYTQFHGGTVNDGLAAIMTSLNRVNGIYEREFAVHMILVADETDVIFTNPGTDPYSDGNAGAMLGQNQSTLDSLIGNANYDIGHVFGGAGGGGVAGLGVVCSAGFKAWGVTSLASPTGDVFDVDYVSHEMGHQYSGNHSFNGTTGSCGGGRNASTAYEPGSGSTIMAYAGICGAEDLQPNSDDYFHAINFAEIFTFVSGGGSAACDVPTAAGHSTPTSNAGINYTIPKSTPFILTGSGTDPDGDTLTYCWEQFDLGAAAPPNTDNGNRPIFRSFDPVLVPQRTFPKLSDILNNTSTLGESLPTTNRTLNFRLSVRDNHAGAGGQAVDSMQVTVSADSGPFLVTQPDTAVTWNSGTQEIVNWNVAGTSGPPVNAANVDILLSADGGNTFGITLAANTPNDGSETITVPATPTTTARIKVAASGNTFFDLSNSDFTIADFTCPTITIDPPTLPDGEVGQAYNQTLTASGGTAPYAFSVTAGTLPSGLNLNSAGILSGTPDTTGTFNFTITAIDNDGCGGTRDYSINITSTTCLFCDDFEDGVLDSMWTYLKPAWSESGGFLTATPSGRKAIAIASPIFGGRSNCFVEAQMRTAGGLYNRVWLLAWYQTKTETVELMMKEESDRWVLKQRSGDLVVAKAKILQTIDPNVNYVARISYDGTNFQVTIDGVLLLTLPAGAPASGTVGFQAKGTTGSFGYIQIN